MHQIQHNLQGSNTLKVHIAESELKKYSQTQELVALQSIVVLKNMGLCRTISKRE